MVTKRLDYESINNYTLKIVAKVGEKEKALRQSTFIISTLNYSFALEYYPWTKKLETPRYSTINMEVYVLLNSFNLNGHTLWFYPHTLYSIINCNTCMKVLHNNFYLNDHNSQGLRN